MQQAVTNRSPVRPGVWGVGYGLTLAAALLLTIYAYRTAQRTEAAREFVDRTSRVLQGIQSLETVATRMEANQRGFLVSGAPRLERARETDHAQTLAAVSELRNLLQRDASQAMRLRDFERALQTRYSSMMESSTIFAMHGLRAAREHFDPDGGKFEPMRIRLAALREEEQRRLVQYSVEAAASTRRFNEVLAWGTLGALLLLLGSGAGLRLQYRRGEALRLELARSNALQRAILESAGSMIIATDPDGKITLFNRAASEALGYAPDEVVGTHDPALFHLDDELGRHAERLSTETGEMVHAGFEALTIRALHGAPENRRWTYVRRDGSRLRVHLAIAAVRDRAGALLGFVGIAQDITDQEQADEDLRLSEHRMRAIIDTASDAFIAIDADGVITDWNTQAERMTGWSRTEALGQRLSTLIVPSQYRPAHEQGLRRYLEDGHGPVLNRRIEISALHRDGREFPIELRVWPLQTDPLSPGLPSSRARVSFNAFVQDITERKAAQDAIRELNAELTEQTAQLAAANRELESFSYSVSHDLRAPLRHMGGYAQILREEAGDRLDASMLRYIDEITTAARRMGMLIDDLLAFSRFSRQVLTMIPIDMNAVIQDAIFDSGLAPNPHARIDVAPLPDAHGDPVLLKQVWVNLISNAVKYSAPRGAEAAISIDGERHDGRVRYRIRDNGVGFDPRYADKLFGVFQRLHSQDEFEGTGVGLAIVQRIVARHRGHIVAHAEPGLGAEFTIELPLHIHKEAAA